MTSEARWEHRHDNYYMNLAKQVKTGADCFGSKIGAVIVLRDRVLSTGYNGTPNTFTNCEDFGCVRCYDSYLYKRDEFSKMSDPSHISGAALDKCICVHAEQNAILTAARHGVSIEGGTLYTTMSPCFNCLKESLQVGIVRIVYGEWYEMNLIPVLKDQYIKLCEHLCNGDATNFMEHKDTLAE